MSRKPSIAGYLVVKNGEGYCALSSNREFKTLPINERIFLLKELNVCILRLIQTLQNERP